MSDFTAWLEPPIWTANLGETMKPAALHFTRGGTGPVRVTVRNRLGEILDDETVEVSFDKAIWHEADWIGTAGTTRTAEVVLTPNTTPPATSNPVYVRVGGATSPWLRAGSLFVDG